MTKPTSLYLDLVRFLAAVAVFLTHLSAKTFGGESLHWLGIEGETAVSVFFVLSGFVIAYVLDTRERTFSEFAASRFARLFSVVLPGLLIVALCDHYGMLRAPALYAHGTTSPERWLACLSFLNRSWLVNGGHGFEFGTDIPLWSLSYEAFYYAMIAVAVFARGWARTLLLIALACVAGPSIISLAPLWFMGFGVYHLRQEFSPRVALALWIGGAVVCLSAVGLEYVDFERLVPGLWRLNIDFGEAASRYFAAGGFALSLVGYRRLEVGGRWLERAHGILRKLGTISFPLYVLHRPLLFFFFAFSPWRGPGELVVFIAGATLATVALIGPLLDATKPLYREAIRLGLRRPGAAT